jgi:hypothetical protein
MVKRVECHLKKKNTKVSLKQKNPKKTYKNRIKKIFNSHVQHAADAALRSFRLKNRIFFINNTTKFSVKCKLFKKNKQKIVFHKK